MNPNTCLIMQILLILAKVKYSRIPNKHTTYYLPIHSYTQEGESEEFLRSMSVQILLQQFLFSEIPNFVGFSIDSSDYWFLNRDSIHILE